MRKFVAATILMMCAATANATIIYQVSRTIGAGTVNGFIETDGTLGILGSGNITDWSFTLTAPNLFGGSPDVIDFATQQQTVVSGTATTATATQLLFDFTAAGINSFLLQGSGPSNYWCIETSGCTDAGVGEHIGFESSGPLVAQTALRSGTIVIASTSVPEPTTLLLLGLGLAGLGFARKRLHSQQASLTNRAPA